MTMLLSDEFLIKYPDMPESMKPIGSFVFYRTYSRWLPGQQRRETFKEMVRRAVNYNVGLGLKHCKENHIPYDMQEFIQEAEEWFDSMFNLGQFLSGRTAWVGGAEGGIAESFPMGNFNCAFTNIEQYGDMADLFYALLVGVGVGFKITKEFAACLPPLRTDIQVIHKPYEPVDVEERSDLTLVDAQKSFAVIHVGDSKEGWVQSLIHFFSILSKESGISSIIFNYDWVRPEGERLKRFGGTASGPSPLQAMFTGFDKVIHNQIDPFLDPLETIEWGERTYVYLRPIHIVDMCNMVGNNVYVGGVRRTAEIALGDPDDWEFVFAKYAINGFWKEEHFQRHEKIGKRLQELGVPKPAWWDEVGTMNYDKEVNGLKPFNYGRPIHHRRMSNNSVIFQSKPDRHILQLYFEIMQLEGEPGFINLEEAARRRLKAMGVKNPNQELLNHVMRMLGLNPCAEILLWSKGVCNLTTINVTHYVRNGKLYLTELLQAQKRSVRAGIRMTMVTLELPEWADVQSRDRLLGLSLTGWYDAMESIKAGEDYETYVLERLKQAATQEAEKYAKRMRIPTPLLDTTIKPEGTISQVFGSVSPGLHRAHSEDFIRRIRISSHDALAKTAKALGWTVNPDTGSVGLTYAEQMANAKTWVIDFPVHSGAKKVKANTSVDEQFDTYFRFQKNYTSHNSSNTITIRTVDEWVRAEERVWEGWDNFVGVSFLALDGGTYKLAPYESITHDQYTEMANLMQPFEPIILKSFENGTLSDLDFSDDCATGACGPR